MLKKNQISCLSFSSLGFLFALSAILPACSFSKPDIAAAPAHPTFEQDVKPLLADHCLLCHGYPATRGAPTNFRLNVYTSTGGVRGAKEEGNRFIRSVLDGNMPPSAHWGDGVGPNGKKLLQNWQSDGYPD